jgi:hypothetical protein
MKVGVVSDELIKCKNFAVNFIDSQADKSNKDFGNNKIYREKLDMLVDTTLGKIGEIALSKLLKEHTEFSFEPDFSISKGRLNTDIGQDIDSFSYRGNTYKNEITIDIKTTKHIAQWLLIESHKINSIFLPDYFALISINIDKSFENDLDRFEEFLTNDTCCEFKGFASKSDFYYSSGEVKWNFKKGKKLLSSNFVKHLERTVKNNYTDLNSKDSFRKIYKSECDKYREQGKNTHLNVLLKANSNLGIPIYKLNKNIKEFVQIFERQVL